MPSRIPSLRFPATLERPRGPTSDFLTSQDQPEDVAHIRVGLRQPKAKSEDIGQQEEVVVSHLIDMRAMPVQVHEHMTLRVDTPRGTRRFAIVSVIDPDEMGRWLELHCKEQLDG